MVLLKTPIECAAVHTETLRGESFVATECAKDAIDIAAFELA